MKRTEEEITALCFGAVIGFYFIILTINLIIEKWKQQEKTKKNHK